MKYEEAERYLLEGGLSRAYHHCADPCGGRPVGSHEFHLGLIVVARDLL